MKWFLAFTKCRLEIGGVDLIDISDIFMVIIIINWKHNRWIVGLFDLIGGWLMVVGWRFDIRAIIIIDSRLVWGAINSRLGGYVMKEMPKRTIWMQQFLWWWWWWRSRCCKLLEWSCPTNHLTSRLFLAIDSRRCINWSGRKSKRILQKKSANLTQVLSFFIGLRYTWCPIYGSRCH